MPRGRKAPPPPPPVKDRATQEAEERLAALLSGDPAQVRAWAARWIPDPLNTIALSSDDDLRASMAAAIEVLTAPIPNPRGER